MKLTKEQDVRAECRRNPDVRFRTARRDGPEKEVGVKEVEEYFQNVRSPRVVKALGRWFEVIDDDRQSRQN